MKPFIERLADFIVATRGVTPNHNPGNVWDGLNPPAKKRRIWPELAIDDGGLVIFPNEEDGRTALVTDLRVKITMSRCTLYTVIRIYFPDQPAAVAAAAAWMGGIEDDLETLAELEIEETEMIRRLLEDGEIQIEEKSECRSFISRA